MTDQHAGVLTRLVGMMQQFSSGATPSQRPAEGLLNQGRAQMFDYRSTGDQTGEKFQDWRHTPPARFVYFAFGQAHS